MSLRFSCSVSLLTLSFLLSPMSDSQVYARWLEHDEANIECLNKRTHYKVHQDGSYTIESETELKILTEAGRRALTTQTYTYNAARSTFEVLEAKTTNNGTASVISKERIEDKPLASGPSGLKKDHQILLPFERVTVGSSIYVKTKEHIFKPSFENYFAASLAFRDGYLWTHNNTTIESELPLFLKVNDPRNNLEVSENHDESKHTFQITLKKPTFEELTGESTDSHGESSLYTSFSFSTEKNYTRTGQLEAKPYQSVLASPLPEDLESIRNSASKIEDETDCIDTVVTALIAKITYLGSWNTAEGLLAPRSLKDIITSGYGDCKEYSICLAAILNKLDYKTKIAIVYRGEPYLENDTLPDHSNFNHAIVKVISPLGKTYWVDPTNNVSMAEGIFPDIADRPALVLDPENPTYERIPPINYQHARTIYERIITIKEDGEVHTDGSLCFEGETAKDFTYGLIAHPASGLKEAVIKLVCEGADPINDSVTLPEHTSGKVKPLKTTFSYGENHAMIHTNSGYAFPLRGNWYSPYVAVSQKDEGALYVGTPQTISKKQVFKNVSAKDLDKLAFSIQTPWLNAKREFSVTNEGVVVTETVEKLKSIIPSKDLKSEAFDKLKKTLRKYCSGVAIVFSE